MNEKLRMQTEQWKNLPRNNVEEITAADDFYDKNIFPLVAEGFVQHKKENKEVCSILFVTVGTSWQPIALSILLHRPRKVIFLGTEGVQNAVAKAIAFVKDLAIPYEFRIVDKGDSRLTMAAVQEVYEAEADKAGCCFDITGGTKAMAAAAAMMAAKLDMQIFYIESNYLPVFRHPDPGSERVVTLLKPQDL